MSYQSIKRVIGETSLERKCRWAFGLTLLVLIGLAFLCVYKVAERHVRNTTRQAARHWAKTELFNYHWRIWDTEEAKRISNAEKSKYDGLREEMISDLLGESYQAKILAVDHQDSHWVEAAPIPSDPLEVATLRKLKEKYDRQLKRIEADLAGRESEVAVSGGSLDQMRASLMESVYEERTVREEGNYYYYHPIYWQESCLRCHSRLQGDAFAASDVVSSTASAPPFRAVRVVMGHERTQRAIIWTQAILFATAIIMMFLSMVGLYLIVRYVIVKPLAHLRDVSDEISRGNTQLRADIQTNDEFQQLADAFNRMLRHLTDTQGELEEVNQELDAKVDELAQLNMQLYEMNRLKDDFLANMSHELRTPLNSIIGFSEVLQGIQSLDDRQRRYARNIQKSGRLLLEMINDILDLAKMEAGKMEVRLSEFRVDVVVGAQCDMVRSLVEAKNIDLDVDVRSDVPPMYQDQAKLQQILTNLLSNAIKFTPEGGRITVAGNRNAHGQLELTVTDTGVGIADSDREIIFEKFRQSNRILGEDGLTREYSGTGLGLSIVKELCKLLGGEITFRSELGKGSTFKVVLPWARSDRPRRDVLDSERIPAPASAPLHPLTVNRPSW